MKALNTDYLDTDYLVVGAGASGLAFVDALIAGSDAHAVLVDRRHAAGGHWLDAYPFVRLHQPSANYGVASRRLGQDRIDTEGVNAGFYERASADEICEYYAQVLEKDLVGSGRVRFLGMSNYAGQDADGHHVVSLLTGRDTRIRARKVVDATYLASDVPARHVPSYSVASDVRLVPPNDLVHLDEPPRRFAVVGGGKTAMDTCSWLLGNGVPPDRIHWIKPRDAWLFNRALTQPLELVAAYMQLQARWVEAAAHASGAADFASRLEASDVFLRVDPTVSPAMFRGATICTAEIDELRSIERVTRSARLRHVGSSRIVLDNGELPSEPDTLFIDCTAAGLRAAPLRPVFEPDRITLQLVTIGFLPWSAATIGAVEASRTNDAEKNALCPPLTFSGNIADVLDLAHTGSAGIMARSADPELARWTEECRLNPARGATARAGSDPQVASALTSIITNLGPAMNNLADLTRLTGRVPRQAPDDAPLAAP